MVTVKKQKNQGWLLSFGLRNQVISLTDILLTLNTPKQMRELRPIKRYVTCLRSHTPKWPGYGWPHLQYICTQIPSSVTVHHTQRCVSEAWVNARVYCWGETTDQSFRFAHLTTDHKLCTYLKPDWNHFSLSDSNFFKTLVFKHDNKRMNFGKHNLVDTA